MSTYIELFKEKTLRNLVSSDMLSEFAIWNVILAVQTLMVFEYNAGAWQISLLFIFSILPRIILSPIIGVLLDKYNKSYLLLFARTFSLSISFLLFFTESVGVLIFLIFLLNISISFNYPATIGILRENLPNEKMDQGIGIVYFISDIMKILAPLIGALLISIFEIQILFLITALMYLLSLLFVFRLRKLVDNSKEISNIFTEFKKPKTFFSDIWISIIHIKNQKLLLLSFFVVASFVYSMNSIETSIVFFVKSLSDNPKNFSLFMASIGIGGALGALLVLKLLTKFKHFTISLTSMILGGVLLLFAPLINNIWLGFLLALIFGVISPSIIMPAEVMKQKLTDKSMSSRVASLNTSVQNTFQLLGASSAGFLVSFFGPSGSFVIAGILMLTMGSISIIIIKLNNPKYIIDNTSTISVDRDEL